MFEIKQGIIRITKGDTAAISVNLKNSNGSAYVMNTGDKIKFTVKSTINSKDTLISKESSTNNIQLEHADTKDLKTGYCFYEIKLVTYDGKVYTLSDFSNSINGNMLVLESFS